MLRPLDNIVSEARRKLAWWRRRRAWDLSGISNPAHKQVVKNALRKTDYPFVRIWRATNKRVPVTISDLSRFSQQVDENNPVAHVHGGDILAGKIKGRFAALGLYWLPTSQYPAGRIELDQGIMVDEALAQEVFLAEAAHCIDYAVITTQQREQIQLLFEHAHEGTHSGWFEETGEETYWAWRGERWMSLFMAAFAPTLTRPLEAEQPWHWTYDQGDIEAVREILK